MPLINLCICILSVVKIERYTQSIRYPLHFLVLVKSCYQLIFIPGDYKENNNVSGIVIQYLLTLLLKNLSRTRFGNFDDAKRKHTLTKIFLKFEWYEMLQNCNQSLSCILPIILSFVAFLDAFLYNQFHCVQGVWYIWFFLLALSNFVWIYIIE